MESMTKDENDEGDGMKDEASQDGAKTAMRVMKDRFACTDRCSETVLTY